MINTFKSVIRLRYMVLFILLFAIIGGGYMVFRSYATVGTFHVYNDTDFNNAVANADGGSNIVLHNGTYPRRVLTKSFSSRVIIEGAAGESVTVAGFDLSSTAANISIRNIKINATVQLAGASYVELSNLDIKVTSGDYGNTYSGCARHGSGIEICQKSHHIDILNNKIDSSTLGLRNIHIYSGISAKASWSHDINIKGNNLGFPLGDNIQILGLYDSTIEGNYIHDPKNNSDHNDGIQLLAGDNIKILRNELTHANGNRSADQAIIIGRYDDASGAINPDLTVNNILVANNLVHHWVGSGITISGATNVKVVNNTSFDNDHGLLISAKNNPSLFNNSGLEVWNNILTNITLNSGGARPAFESNNVVLGGGGGANLATATPIFINRDLSSSERYKLANNDTIAINKGVGRASTPANDFDNKVRVGLPDRGARESAITTISPTPGTNSTPPADTTPATTVSPQDTTQPETQNNNQTESSDISQTGTINVSNDKSALTLSSPLSKSETKTIQTIVDGKVVGSTNNGKVPSIDTSTISNGEHTATVCATSNNGQKLCKNTVLTINNKLNPLELFRNWLFRPWAGRSGRMLNIALTGVTTSIPALGFAIYKHQYLLELARKLIRNVSSLYSGLMNRA